MDLRLDFDLTSVSFDFLETYATIFGSQVLTQ